MLFSGTMFEQTGCDIKLISLNTELLNLNTELLHFLLHFHS